jgi:hypothetical protein
VDPTGQVSGRLESFSASLATPVGAFRSVEGFDQDSPPLLILDNVTISTDHPHAIRKK